MSLTAIHTGSNLNKDLQNIACTKSSFVNKNALESLFPHSDRNRIPIRR